MGWLFYTDSKKQRYFHPFLIAAHPWLDLSRRPTVSWKAEFPFPPKKGRRSFGFDKLKGVNLPTKRRFKVRVAMNIMPTAMSSIGLFQNMCPQSPAKIMPPPFFLLSLRFSLDLNHNKHALRTYLQKQILKKDPLPSIFQGPTTCLGCDITHHWARYVQRATRVLEREDGVWRSRGEMFGEDWFVWIRVMETF